jgi:BMFP domain-containing protein YqiC
MVRERESDAISRLEAKEGRWMHSIDLAERLERAIHDEMLAYTREHEDAGLSDNELLHGALRLVDPAHIVNMLTLSRAIPPV